MRREYLSRNLGILGKIWAFSTVVALCVLLIRTTTDPGMIVLSVAIGFVFTCLVCEKLNSLTRVKDTRFMLHSIFWMGCIGFGLVTLFASKYFSMLTSLVLQGFFNALSLSLVVFYHTGTQSQYQRTLE